MLSHVSLGVTNLTQSTRFYDAALAALGYVRQWTGGTGVEYGAPGDGGKFALFLKSDAHAPGAGFHLALVAPNRAAVNAFHVAALAEGGVDDGPPGLRPKYGPGYYACFVRDPDGYKIEALVHET